MYFKTFVYTLYVTIIDDVFGGIMIMQRIINLHRSSNCLILIKTP